MERDEICGISEFNVYIVVKPQTDDNAAAPKPTTFGEHTECLDNSAAISQMPIGISRPGSSYTRLDTGIPQFQPDIPSRTPTAAPNSSPIWNPKSIKLVSYYP